MVIKGKRGRCVCVCTLVYVCVQSIPCAHRNVTRVVGWHGRQEVGNTAEKQKHPVYLFSRLCTQSDGKA